MYVLMMLTTSVTAFSTVNFHEARVLLTLAVFSPTWAMDFMLTVILTTGDDSCSEAEFLIILRNTIPH